MDTTSTDRTKRPPPCRQQERVQDFRFGTRQPSRNITCSLRPSDSTAPPLSFASFSLLPESWHPAPIPRHLINEEPPTPTSPSPPGAWPLDSPIKQPALKPEQAASIISNRARGDYSSKFTLNPDSGCWDSRGTPKRDTEFPRKHAYLTPTPSPQQDGKKYAKKARSNTSKPINVGLERGSLDDKRLFPLTPTERFENWLDKHVGDLPGGAVNDDPYSGLEQGYTSVRNSRNRLDSQPDDLYLRWVKTRHAGHTPFPRESKMKNSTTDDFLRNSVWSPRRYDRAKVDQPSSSDAYLGQVDSQPARYNHFQILSSPPTKKLTETFRPEPAQAAPTASRGSTCPSDKDQGRVDDQLPIDTVVYEAFTSSRTALKKAIKSYPAPSMLATREHRTHTSIGSDEYLGWVDDQPPECAKCPCVPAPSPTTLTETVSPLPVRCVPIASISDIAESTAKQLSQQDRRYKDEKIGQLKGAADELTADGCVSRADENVSDWEDLGTQSEYEDWEVVA